MRFVIAAILATEPIGDAHGRRSHRALVDAMTLEEKVALVAGRDSWTTVPIERLGIPSIKVSDGPNGARGGGAFVGGVARRRASRSRSRFPRVGTSRWSARSAPPSRTRRDSKGARVLAGADGQHAPLDAQRPQLRMLFRGPAPRQRNRRRLHRRVAEPRRRRDRQAFHRQRDANISGIRSAPTSTSAR